MGWISREAVLSKYGLKEPSLMLLESSQLLPENAEVRIRNRIGYDDNSQNDLLFRIARLSVDEVTNSTYPRLPMHRAFISLCMAEGPDVAADVLRRRTIYPMSNQESAARWRLFLKNVPPEAQESFATAGAPLNDAGKLVVRFLEIEEAYDDGGLLNKFNLIFHKVAMRGLLDGLLYHHANFSAIARCLNDLYLFELVVEQILFYQRYFFDVLDMAQDDLAVYVSRFSKIRDYYETLSIAVQHKELVRFVGAMNLPAEIEKQQMLRYALRECQRDIVGIRAGTISQTKFNRAVERSIQITTHLQNQTALEAAKAVGAGGAETDIPDLVALKHDMEANQQALHELAEIPSVDRDKVAAGPVGTVKPTGTDSE